MRMNKIKRNTREYYHYLLDSALDQMVEGDFLLSKFVEVFLKDEKDEAEYRGADSPFCSYCKKFKTPEHWCYGSE